VGSIDLTEDFHPLDVTGQASQRLWVFGVLSEGVRYFTLYIPSPKSRVRAFIDADFCANQVIGGDRVIELGGPSAQAAASASPPGGLGAGRLPGVPDPGAPCASPSSTACPTVPSRRPSASSKALGRRRGRPGHLL